MTAILITGMSGTGKSSVIDELRRSGYAAVETDEQRWLVPAPLPDSEWLWDEAKIGALLDEHAASHLFISGTRENQGRLYPRFDHRVLLTAPIEVMLRRVTTRTTNPFGSNSRDRDKITRDKENYEPVLRKGADLVIDTSTATPAAIAERLIALL